MSLIPAGHAPPPACPLPWASVEGEEPPDPGAAFHPRQEGSAWRLRDLEQMSASSQGAGKAAISIPGLTSHLSLPCPSPHSLQGPQARASHPFSTPMSPKEWGTCQGASRSGLRPRGRGWGPPGNTLTTADLFFPRYYAIHSSAESKPKPNGTQSGLNLGPLWVSGDPGAERGPRVRPSFGSQLGKHFPIPGWRSPPGEPQP